MRGDPGEGNARRGNACRSEVEAPDTAAERAAGGVSAERDRILYVADLIDELRTMAGDMRLDLLERLLGLAHDEAMQAALPGRGPAPASQRTR